MPRTDRRSAQTDLQQDRGKHGDLYAEVTAKIIAELEAGRFPWVQPWDASGGNASTGTSAAPGLPRNALTRRTYSGINILILWGAVIEHGYADQRWLTFRQAQQAGGNVIKGERGVTVVYADRFVPKGEGERARRDGDDAKTVPFLKRFTVFNVAQCRGLSPGLSSETVALPPCEPVAAAEALIAASGADFRIGGDKAFYVPSADFIQVPPQPAFHDQINYYRTALHELTHWTGHGSRLARDLANRFGTHGYAREELVAEMGAAFLCASLGIVPTVRHADYLGNWLEVLREDLSDDPAVRGTGGPRGRAIFRAASAASRAADYLLAFTATDAGTDELGGPEADQRLRRAAA